jgi:hypothetical protein
VTDHQRFRVAGADRCFVNSEQRKRRSFDDLIRPYAQHSDCTRDDEITMPS